VSKLDGLEWKIQVEGEIIMSGYVLTSPDIEEFLDNIRFKKHEPYVAILINKAFNVHCKQLKITPSEACGHRELEVLIAEDHGIIVGFHPILLTEERVREIKSKRRD
jgi:hypothetical protein